MRFRSALVALALFRSSAEIGAQAAQDSLTPRHLAGGLSFTLPISWKALSDAVQERARLILDTVLLHSSDSLLQTSLRLGKPVILLHETAPGQLDPSASLNAAPAPGTTSTSFETATSNEVAAAGAQLCSTTQSLAARLGVHVVSCGPSQLDRAAGRTMLITRLVRTGALGFVTVWIVQFPDRDVVYTLTLSAPQAQESYYGPLFQTVWRSVTISAP